MYVIVRDDGQYVAPPGQHHSYTDKLQHAHVYEDRARAEADRCVENERVVAVADALAYRMRPSGGPPPRRPRLLG